MGAQFLAERQPELRDVSLAILKSRGMSADEGWLSIIEPYQGFVSYTSKEHRERDRINPGHFGEFLSYLGKGLLLEMVKQAGKNWQEAQHVINSRLNGPKMHFCSAEECIS